MNIVKLQGRALAVFEAMRATCTRHQGSRAVFHGSGPAPETISTHRCMDPGNRWRQGDNCNPAACPLLAHLADEPAISLRAVSGT